VDEAAYQHSMTVVAAFTIDGELWSSDGFILAAFVNDTCRGLARPMYLTATGSYAAFLMIHSNQISGEAVVFRVLATETGTIYRAAEVVSYEADEALGSVRVPMLLTAESVEAPGTGETPAAYSLSGIRPNPFRILTSIRFQSPERGQLRLKVYDARGRRVRVLTDRVWPAGYHQLSWDRRDSEGLPVASGIYFVEMRADRFSEVRKMVVLR
jgi:hypothetical protein